MIFDSRSSSPAQSVPRRYRRIATALLMVLAGLSAQTAWAQSADELAGQARAAAQKDDHREAARLFGDAIAQAPERRPEWLLEYADHIAYAGRPADAVPLYRERLAQAGLDSENRQRAERSLAFALLWSGQFPDAVRAWETIAAARPGDTAARNTLIEAVIGSARAAANRGNHREAAALFERAFGLDPAKRPAFEREYADQVAYSGQPGQAVSAYREVLRRPDLSGEERERTARNLAFALLWSSAFADAIQAWEPIVRAKPGDAEARKALSDAFVGAARQAAGRSRNAEAVTLFQRAIDTVPDRRAELLPEYADQVAFSGTPAMAVPLYREGLRRTNLSGPERTRLERGLASALLWSSQFREAIPAWKALLAQSPRDKDARKALSDAYVGAARQAAGQARNAAAATLFRQALAVTPERRGELLREYADQVLYSGQHARAVPLFRELARRPDLKPAEWRAARLGLARAYLWSGQNSASVPWFSELLAASAEDTEARTGRGQAYNNTAEYKAALADFELVLEREPASKEAIRGAAQAEGSMGRPRAALARLEPLLAQGDREPATLIIVAYSRRAIGRPDLVEEDARALLARNPNDPIGRQLLDEVTRERRPLTLFEAWHAVRSDDLRVSSLFLSHEMTFNQGLTKIGPQARTLTFRGGDFPDVDIASIGIAGTHRFNDWLELKSSLFLNFENEPIDEDVALTHETVLSFIPSDLVRIGLIATRRYPDENSWAIVNDIFATDGGVSVDVTPDNTLRFTGRALYSSYTDGNERIWGQVEVARRFSESPALWLGARYTAFDFAKVYDNGYWNPDSYQAIEASLHFYGSFAERWSYDIQAAAGFGGSEPGSSGLVASGTARLSYALNDQVSLALYASHLVSYARTGDEGSPLPTFDDTPFTRAAIGAQLNMRW